MSKKSEVTSRLEQRIKAEAKRRANADPSKAYIQHKDDVCREHGYSDHREASAHLHHKPDLHDAHVRCARQHAEFQALGRSVWERIVGVLRSPKKGMEDHPDVLSEEDIARHEAIFHHGEGLNPDSPPIPAGRTIPFTEEIKRRGHELLRTGKTLHAKLEGALLVAHGHFWRSVAACHTDGRNRHAGFDQYMADWVWTGVGDAVCQDIGYLLDGSGKRVQAQEIVRHNLRVLYPKPERFMMLPGASYWGSINGAPYEGRES